MTDQPQDATTPPTFTEAATQQPDRRAMLAGMGLLGLAGIATLAKTAQAGPLNPPAGPIAPTGRTMQEIYDRVARTAQGLAEPRIPVQSLPSSGTAVYAITQPGSYYLTGNITPPPGLSGIMIMSDDVSIDLCGFTLRGESGCPTGIQINSGVKRTSISNGSIVGWTSNGVSGELASQTILTDLSLQDNRLSGADIGALSTVRRCTANRNLAHGFRVGANSTVDNSITVQNGSSTTHIDADYLSGVFALAAGCVVRDHTSMNDRVGIRVESGGVVEGCRITSPTSWAIRIGPACQVISNIVSGGWNGIEATDGTIIMRNSIASVDWNGVLLLGNANQVSENSVVGCHYGIVSYHPALRNFITANSVSATSTYGYQLGTTRATYGPIVDITTNSGMTLASLWNSDHPQANFNF